MKSGDFIDVWYQLFCLCARLMICVALKLIAIISTKGNKVFSNDTEII